MADGDELVDELAALWRAMPRPDPSWHSYVELMRRVDDDVRAALAVLALDDAARAALEDAVERPAAPAAAGDALDDAVARLAALPRPEGQHPFLFEIAPALDAAAALLAAVGASGPARRRFGELAA